MPLSVSNSNGGNGLSNLLRQTRPLKNADDGTNATTGDQPAIASRSVARTAIDSTGIGTAQITAALTIYLSNLGGVEPGSEAESVTPVGKPQGKTAGSARDGLGSLTTKSGAADLLRVLDTYGTQGSAALKRLSA